MLIIRYVALAIIAGSLMLIKAFGCPTLRCVLLLFGFIALAGIFFVYKFGLADLKFDWFRWIILGWICGILAVFFEALFEVIFSSEQG